MNLLRTIARKIVSSSKKVKAAVLVATALAVVSGAVYAGYTPANRPTFDWNNPADRVGSVDGPVLNSFVNTPYYGDERAFFDARMSNDTTVKDVLPYVTSSTGTREVILRTYVHNNGNQDLNASGKTVAKDVKVRIALPTGTGTNQVATSYISASNTVNHATDLVSDTTNLVDPTAFSVSYVPGSAKIYNNAHTAGLTLNDNIVTTGDAIGFDQMDGNLPGCFNYQAIVEIHVKVNVPTVSITKQVKNATDADWKKSTTAKPGETVKWLVTVKNTGSTTLDDVDVSDALPPHFQVVPGSVKRTDGANSGVAQNDTSLFTDKGIDFTSYGSNATLYVRFDTVVKDDLDTCSALMTNQAFVTTKQTPAEIKDTANVTITKDNCTPPSKIVTCDALTAPSYSLNEGQSTLFTAAAHAVNATINTYSFRVNGQVVQNTASNQYTFTQAHEGTYTVDVTAKSTIGDVTSPACAKTVHVQKVTTPIYSCDAMTFSKPNPITGQSFTTSVNYTAAGGATFKQATFNFGDDTKFTTNTSTNGVVSTDHSYAAKGTYAVTVSLQFLVNGQVKTVDGGKCANQLTVTPIATVVTALPDTGAGNMIGLFAAVTAAGAVLHNLWMRKFNR